MITYLAVILLLVSAALIDGRSMWGSRRKREQDEGDEHVYRPPAPDGANLFDSQKHFKRASGGAFDGTIGADAGSAIQQMVDLYIQMMEEMLDSDDFSKMVNPESIKTMMQQFPGFSDSPELTAIFDAPEFRNPELLKATVQQGLAMIKASAPELIATLSDPSKIAELMEQLPEEVKSMVESVLSGDVSGLKDIVSTLPGLDDKQKQLLYNLMDGKTDSLTQQLGDVLGDAAQVEEARQQFLANPEMAEALGIPAEVLNDPKLWADMMAEGMEALSAAEAEAEDDTVIKTKKKLFAR